MIHNYFFIRRLATALDHKLSGAVLQEVFSQQKDELVIGFSLQNKTDFFIKATLDPVVNLISFQDSFRRAKKNSIDLFEEITGKMVLNTHEVPYDRSFYIELEGDRKLLFKLHGNRSNIILISPDRANILFKSKLAADKAVSLDSIAKPLLDYKAIEDEESLVKLEKIAGKELMSHLKNNHNYDSLPFGHKAQILRETLSDTEKSPITVLREGKPSLSLLYQDHVTLKTDDPIEACNILYKETVTGYLFEKEKQGHIHQLQQKIKRSENYIKKNQQKIDEIKNRRSYEEVANIIMANLHAIPKGTKKIKLYDFYAEDDIDIKLNKELTPQKNAEQYYRKSKNEKIELQKLQENIDKKEEIIFNTINELEEIQKIDNHKELRKKLQKSVATKEKNQKPLPYKKFLFNGYEIRVGKNAASNDELTLRYTHKEDLWLHARDVAGSHVIIKSNKNKVPESVIEYAAGLAAYYSKRKHDSLCPVIMTPRKYVRKGKGMGPGKVIVEKEEVVMVAPITPQDN